MQRQAIPFKQFSVDIVKLWADDWLLLTAGVNEPGRFNPMTVAWGSFGVMWSKPFAQIVVRPSRHTDTFIRKCDSFTLSAFDESHRKMLNLCGTKSGRDIDKIAETGLTPIASTQVESPGFDEAELIVECRTIYRDALRPEGFGADYIEPCYGGEDYHNVYFGEIVAIEGIDKYRSGS